MQQFVNILVILACLVMSSVCTGSREVSLNEEFGRCEAPNCTITLHRGEYIIDRMIAVEGWDYFELSAPRQTVIRCVYHSTEDYAIILITQTDNIVIENITFVNCSRPSSIFEPENETSIIYIDWAVSLQMASCYFPDYSQIALRLNNIETVALTDSYFIASREHTYKRAVIYRTNRSLYKNVSFHANNITLDGGNVTYAKELTELSLISHQGMGGSLVFLMDNSGLVSIDITNSTIRNSKAIIGGGVLFQLWRNDTKYHVVVVNCIFEHNSASVSKVGKGGALVVRALSEQGNITIKNCTFRNNTAVSGGAVGLLLYGRVQNTHIRILDSVFLNNSAETDSGGAIFAENLYILNTNELYIKNTEFAFNKANSGGAIFTLDFYLDLGDNVRMHHNRAYYGGAISLLGSRLSLYGNDISLERNNASHSGGALYVHSSSTVIAYGHRTLIANNSAKIRGGGIFVFTKYFENRRHDDKSNWRDDGELFSFSCFLHAKRGIKNAITLSGNKVTSGIKLCMGDDLFTNTWGPCYNKSEKNPISRGIVFKDEDTNHCSIALDIVAYNPLINLTSPCQLRIGPNLTLTTTDDCNDNLDLNSLPDYKDRLKKAITKRGLESEGNKTLHLFFPGYQSQVDVQSLDGMKTPIQTITRIIFKPETLDKSPKYHLLEIALSGSKNFTIKKISREFIFGKICLQSYSTLNEVTLCEDAIIGDCPSPLLSAETGHSCKFKEIAKFDDHNIKKHRLENNRYTIQMNPGTLFTYPRNESTDFVFMHCTWFQCNCHVSASIDECVFNVNAPQKQCRDELRLPYCTECIDHNKRICPPFNWFCKKASDCFSCNNPYLTIALYFIMTLGITVIICLLPIYVFSDYIRSIVFYSSTLYVFSINCGTFEERVIYKTLSIPIAILNLLVTDMFPFCLPTNKPIYLAMFNMAAPFMFIVYVAIIILLITKVPYISRLGQFNVVDKVWTIIILTYVHLCNQAFNVLNCPINSLGERTWMYDGSQRCLVGEHLVASIMAILLLFALVIFPFIMLIFSNSNNPDYKMFVKIYEDCYFTNYKHWELFKICLRVLFPFMVTLLPQAVKAPQLPCSIVSIVCLLLLVLNSLLTPARTENANRYESMCYIILAYVGFQSEKFKFGKYFVNLIVLFPYIIGVFIIVYKACIWLRGRKIFKFFRCQKE